MSGQWEIVGKKKEKGPQKIVSQPQTNNKKKSENTNVKVEDVFSKSQVRNLYSNDKNKENKPLEERKGSDGGAKKPQKKQEKRPEAPKPKAPKSIESALSQIDVEEFRNVYESSKAHFPDASIVWLKDLAHFLNQKVNLEVQDPLFSSKLGDFPLSAVPSGIKSVMEKAVQESQKGNVQLFFDISLTSMATDMSKNLPALGHKLFLQYIALNHPSLVTASLSKHCILRSSYQNRSSIGLSILWAVGQAGTCNFNDGLTIFQELMLPLIELKNYSRYVVKYLLDLISRNKEAALTSDQFLLILDVIFAPKKNFPNDLKQDLVSVIPNLKAFLFSSKSKQEKYKTSVELFLKKIAASEVELYKRCLCDIIIESFDKDSSSLEHWSKIYTKNVASSAILLQYIDSNWKTVSNKFQKRVFVEVLKEINVANDELLPKKKKNEGVVEAKRSSDKLLEKMTAKRKSGSSLKLVFILISAIVAAGLYYDIKREGSWQKSNTNAALTKYGFYEYCNSVKKGITDGWLLVDGKIEENFPTYRKTVIEFSEPWVELAGNLGKVLGNLYANIVEVVKVKYPVVVASIESYAPGFMEQSQNAVSTAWSSSVFYFSRSVDYLRKEVFVGQLSPENVQKVVYEAFNTTQNKASEYYYWLYEKVQSAIK